MMRADQANLTSFTKLTSGKKINLDGARSLLILVLCGLVVTGATLAQAASSLAASKRCAFDIGLEETGAPYELKPILLAKQR